MLELIYFKCLYGNSLTKIELKISLNLFLFDENCITLEILS